jgi:hypothetical protein
VDSLYVGLLVAAGLVITALAAYAVVKIARRSS